MPPPHPSWISSGQIVVSVDRRQDPTNCAHGNKDKLVRMETWGMKVPNAREVNQNGRKRI